MMNNHPHTLPGVGSLPTAPPAQLPVPQAAGMPRYDLSYISGVVSTSGPQFFPKMEAPPPPQEKKEPSIAQNYFFKSLNNIKEF